MLDLLAWEVQVVWVFVAAVELGLVVVLLAAAVAAAVVAFDAAASLVPSFARHTRGL